MVHGHDERKKRRARPGVEPLDNRVVPSGASALGTPAVAAAAHLAAPPHQGVATRFGATVSHIESQVMTPFDRASHRIDHVETIDQGAVDRAAARTIAATIPSARAAAVRLTRSTDTIARNFDQSAIRTDLRWNRTARILDDRLDQAVRRDVRRDPALEPMALAAEAHLTTLNAELGSRLAGQLAAARTNLQAAISSAQATAANVPAQRATGRPGAAFRAALGRVQHAPAVLHPIPGVRAAVRSAATATTTPFLAAGVTSATQFGTAGSPINGTGLGPVPATMGTLATGGISGSAGNGAFGVGTFGGTGDLVGGTPPSPVTGTTGAGVDTGLDTFGIGTGLGVGSGIDMTPNGDGLLF